MDIGVMGYFIQLFRRQTMKQFEVWCPENGQTREDAITIAAFDAELAGTLWDEWHDGYTAEFEIVNGTELLVCVSECGADTVQEFTVYGEMERVYRCRGVRNLGNGGGE